MVAYIDRYDGSSVGEGVGEGVGSGVEPTSSTRSRLAARDVANLISCVALTLSS